MSSARLAGQRALVTGASTGIGRAIAIRFAQEGASVAINYRSQTAEAATTKRLADEAAAAAGHSGARSVVIQADVADETQILRMFAEATAALGGLDSLINNAGIQKPVATEDLTAADFDHIIGVNLRGTFLCSREAVRHFLSRGYAGVIVNNSSVHEIIPKPKY